jgi:predicted dinucleotide-binding enzyme
MKTLGLIGAGHIGSQLARLAVKSGHDVVVSNSRGPQTLADLVRELGPHARAATPEKPPRPATSSSSRSR